MAHTIQAGEILQMHFLKDKKLPLYYTNIFGPGGPGLFTGPLKAASYLLLDTSLTHIVYIMEKKDTEEINEQLMYAKIIKNIEEYSVIVLSKRQSVDLLIKKLQGLQKKKTVAYIFLGTASKDLPIEQAQKEDEHRARALLLKKKYTKDPSWIGNAFVLWTKLITTKTDIIGYVNTADVGGNPQKTTGYLSVVG